MTLKVVDVPDNAVLIEFKGIGVSGSLRFMSNVYVSGLPDAPTVAENATVEKSVIELPNDLLKNLATLKKQSGDDLQKFMNDVNQDGIWDRVQSYNTSKKGTDVLLGKWWLGYAEFVPKKEPKYRYRMTSFDNPYITSDKEGGLFLTAVSIREQQLFTHREIERLASEKGFKLSAFKEIEVEE